MTQRLVAIPAERSPLDLELARRRIEQHEIGVGAADIDAEAKTGQMTIPQP